MSFSPSGQPQGAPAAFHRWQESWRCVLAPVLRRHRGWIAAALTLGVLGAALAAIEPLFLKFLVDLVAGRRAHGNIWNSGVKAVVTLGVVLVMQRLVQTGQSLAVNRVRFETSFDLSSRTLSRLYARPLSFHQSSGAGYVLTRVDRGVAAMGQAVTALLQALVPNVANLALMAALLWHISPRLAVLGLAPMPLFLWATVRGAARLAAHEEAVQEGWSRLYSRVNEVLSGIKTVQSLGGEPQEIREYRRQARAVFSRLWKLVWAEAGYGELQGSLALTGKLSVAGYGFWLVAHAQVSTGTWVAATSYVALLYGPLAGLAGTATTVARQMAAASAVLEVLAEGETAPEMTVTVPKAHRVEPFRPLQGAITFERVSYAYPAAEAGAARNAIDRMSFEIAAGETVAVIGPSGGGKSTLMDLLMRFHDPSEGRILVDGVDVRSLPIADLRRQMAVVLQEPLLLEGTIAENVAYGCADVSAARLRAAIEAAQAAEFIARLPQGLETRLGERGARLSGGEKQRLAIARALLRDPRILILDEATAHLDAASEAALNRALTELVRGRTALIISHRMESLLATDRVFVIDRGRLLEEGTPATLHARGGYYARWKHFPSPA